MNVGSAKTDEVRRAELRRMRVFATGLLGLMLLVYVACRAAEARYGVTWLSYVEAFAEAAMVGAIADWFAVTALFRHPLGVPIPHTAIVPRNKDRIAVSIGNFIANNFLVEEVVCQKLRSLRIGRRIALWLSRPENVSVVVDRMAAAVPAVLDALDQDHTRQFVRDGLLRSLRAVDAAPVAGRLLSVLVARRHHQMLFDRMIELANDFLRANQHVIRRRVSDQSRWWVPKWAEEKLVHKIVDGIEQTLGEARDPAHPWRERLNTAAEDLVNRLMVDPEFKRKGEQVKEEILASSAVQGYVDSLWSEIRERVRQDARDPGGVTRKALEQALLALGRKLADDREMQAVIDGWVERFTVEQLVPYRQRIGEFFSGVVMRWDVRTTVSKLELLVGKDLQYIRINGTVVGGAVGLIIHAVTTAVT